MKKIAGCFFVVLFFLLCTEKIYAAEQPDFDKKCSINIYMRDASGNLVTGGNLEVYKVAGVQVTRLGNKYVYTGEFANSGYSLDEKDAASLAMQLYNYALDNDMHGEVYDNKTGIVKVEDISSGLYLINNKIAPEGYNRGMPFLVSAPFKLDGIWLYEVDATPKMSLLDPKPPLGGPTPDPPGPEPNPPGLDPNPPGSVPNPPDAEPDPPGHIGGPRPNSPELDNEDGSGLQHKIKSNLIKYINSPKTGDTNGHIFAIIICLFVLCVAYVLGGIYLLRKKEPLICGTDFVEGVSETVDKEELKN